MRRFLSVALIGLAIAGSTTVALAQGRGRAPGRAVGRGGVMDTARARRMDSLRAERGEIARKRLPDSVRQHRIDSLRAAGVLDSGRVGRGRGPGPGPGGRGPDARGPMGGGRGGALAGIKLNDNEEAAVKTIGEKYRGEMEQLREANKGQARGQNAQLRTQVQAIAEKEQAEIRAALTAEHQAQFDANLAKRPARGAAPAGRRPPPPPAPRDR